MDKQTLAMYTEYLANYISGGRLIGRDKIASLGLKPVFDRYLTKTYITKIWYVYHVPCNYSRNFTEGIRKRMFKEFPTVRTIVRMCCHPVNVETESRIYKTKLTNISVRLQKLQRIYGAARDDQKLTGQISDEDSLGRYRITRDDIQQAKNEKDSLMYVYSEVNKGNSMFETYYIIQASAKDYRTLKKYGKKLGGLLRNEGIKYQELKGNISEYLMNFCPATFNGMKTKIKPVLFSEENIVSQMSYRTKGLPTKKGLLIGLDWQSKLPFFHNPFESSGGQVNMILSRTGWGKTYIGFGIALAAVGFDAHFSAIDIKGEEWCKLAPFVDMKVIDMKGFINTMRVDEIPCTEEDSADVLREAITLTSMMIFMMTDLQEGEGNKSDLIDIVDQATIKYYAKIGVFENKPETFVRSKKMNYRELMNLVAELKSTASFNLQQKAMCDLIRTRCSKFFSPSGKYYESFKEEITVGDILNTPAIVYSMDKNAGGELDLLDSIRVFECQALDSKKQQIRKRQKKHTFAFYEELQRCQHNEMMINYISSRTTGSRSSNVTVYLILNAVSVFEADALKQIKSNITTKIIGKVTTEDINYLVNHMDCKEIEDYMLAINDEANSNEYRNCFAIQYDTGVNVGKAIIKADFPKDISNSFNTRDILEI